MTYSTYDAVYSVNARLVVHVLIVAHHLTPWKNLWKNNLIYMIKRSYRSESFQQMHLAMADSSMSLYFAFIPLPGRRFLDDDVVAHLLS